VFTTFIYADRVLLPFRRDGKETLIDAEAFYSIDAEALLTFIHIHMTDKLIPLIKSY